MSELPGQMTVEDCIAEVDGLEVRVVVDDEVYALERADRLVVCAERGHRLAGRTCVYCLTVVDPEEERRREFAEKLAYWRRTGVPLSVPRSFRATSS